MIFYQLLSNRQTEVHPLLVTDNRDVLYDFEPTTLQSKFYALTLAFVHTWRSGCHVCFSVVTFTMYRKTPIGTHTPLKNSLSNDSKTDDLMTVTFMLKYFVQTLLPQDKVFHSVSSPK